MPSAKRSTAESTTTDDVARKGRTLCLCFDGTAESYEGCQTNIVHIFSLLEKNDPSRQLVYYQASINPVF